jgi:predicted PurR-regulated permease PerM
MEQTASPRGRGQTIALVVIATILVGWVLHAGASILQPIVIALLLANVFQPVVRAFERRRIPGPVAVVFLSAILVWAIFQVTMLVQSNVSVLLGQTTVTEQPILNEDGVGIAKDDEGKPMVTRVTTWTRISKNLSDRIDKQNYMSEDVKDSLKSALDSFDVQGAFASLIGGGIDFSRTLMIILIYMAFIFAEQSIFKRKIMAIAGPRHREAASALDTMSRGVQRYLSIKTLISLLTGVLCYFLLVFTQVPYAVIFALLTFLLNYIPTFGSIVAGILAALTALAVHDSVVPAMVVAAGYITVNIVLGSVVEPRILGRELNISPLVIIISVVFWVGLWGVVGGFLAVPLTAAIQIVLANSDRGRPIAILLSGAPPPDESSEAKRSPRLALRRRKSE